MQVNQGSFPDWPAAERSSSGLLTESLQNGVKAPGSSRKHLDEKKP
jgi:hypothetical protein